MTAPAQGKPAYQMKAVITNARTERPITTVAGHFAKDAKRTK